MLAPPALLEQHAEDLPTLCSQVSRLVRDAIGEQMRASLADYVLSGPRQEGGALQLPPQASVPDPERLHAALQEAIRERGAALQLLAGQVRRLQERLRQCELSLQDIARELRV